MPTPWRTRRGVTLIELLIVIMMIGLLTAFALPKWVKISSAIALESAAQQVARELSTAHMQAIKYNRTVVVQRHGATDYQVDAGTRKSLPDGVRFATTTATRIEFASFGPASTGAVTWTLQKDGAQKLIQMSATGRARVQ